MPGPEEAGPAALRFSGSGALFRSHLLDQYVLLWKTLWVRGVWAAFESRRRGETQGDEGIGRARMMDRSGRGSWTENRCRSGLGLF